MPRGPSRLSQETSPYLLSAASDLVDWYPFAEEAFAQARARNLPIFLSIGYSACHFCHRMQRESFRDAEIAALLNQHFLCIKLDREERPDLDAVYLSALSSLTPGGGWPANLFLMPSGEPFFGGTYFPPRSQNERPGFLELITQIAKLWKESRPELERQSSELVRVLREANLRPESFGLSSESARTARHRLDQSFDESRGGFGRAPKFAHPGALRFLLSEMVTDAGVDPSGHRSPAEMALVTLDRMSEGSLYDQVGGGFFRYCTDERWLVPHFEKMAADQAQLAGVYLEAFRITGRPSYRRIARETLDFLLRSLRGPHGGFFSSLDADSAPTSAATSEDLSPGAFYLLTPADVRAAAGEPMATHFCAFFGIVEEGPFAGKSLASAQRPQAEVAREFGISEAELSESLDAALEALRAARSARPQPEVDDKIIAANGGLILTTLARAAFLLEQPEYLDAAERAARVLLEELNSGGRLHRYTRGEPSRAPGCLEDYVCLAEGLLTLHELTGRADFLTQSRQLIDQALERFEDETSGALRAGENPQAPWAVSYPAADAAFPPANAVAVRVLTRLSVHTGSDAYRVRAGAIARTFCSELRHSPERYAELLCAASPLFEQPVSLVLAGDDDELLRAALKLAPPAVVLARSRQGETPSALTRGKPSGGAGCAFVCVGETCKQPAKSEPELRERLLQACQEAYQARRRELGHQTLPGRATAEATRQHLDRRDVREAARGRLGELCVSSIGVGTRRIGLDTTYHRDALRAALKGGVNLIDTSPAFALGESERLVGQVLAEVCSAGYTRESYVIATKVGVALGQLASELAQNELWASEAVPLSPGGALKDGAFCLQEDFLLTQLRRSRERLGLEHLDVVLIQSPESLLLGGLPWDEARLRLGRALALLERECQAGSIGRLGVFTATATRTPSDRAFVPLLDLLALAEEVGGKQHHFGVCELPINLVESEALTHSMGGTPTPPQRGAQAHSQASANLSLAAQLRERGISVWAARPLSALSGEAVTRLVDPPADSLPKDRAQKSPPLVKPDKAAAAKASARSPSASSDTLPPELLRSTRYKVASLEAEFETTFAAKLRLAGVKRQGPLLPLAGALGKALEQVHSLEQFHLAETTMVTPQLRGLLRQLDRAFTDDPGQEWARFRAKYTRAVGDYLAAVRQLAADRNRALLGQLRRELPNSPAFGHLPTAAAPPARFGQLALGALMQHPDVAATIVGMRSALQAEEALALLK